MYERFYNLTTDPFRLSPDHRFCYQHPQYTKAKAYMSYAFRRAEGFVMVTGDPGTGKTTLIGDLVEYLAAANVVVANLVTTQLAADDLLRMVGYSFGVNSQETDKSNILQDLADLFTAMHRDGSRALLIVDEAQDLSTRAMEELRLLSNLQLEGRPLLQIFLLGQPELREIVREKGLEPLHQRIIAASHLEALQENQTRAYVEHRLHVVGWKNDPEISSAVYPIIYRFSEGVPRRINLICNRLLLHGFVEQSHRITVAHARTVVDELQGEQLSGRNRLHESYFRAEDSFERAETVSAPAAQSAESDPPAAPTGKALFQAQDLAPPPAPAIVKEKKVEVEEKEGSGEGETYDGPEKRRIDRRSMNDRREDIRFETGKEDRRKNRGRRDGDNSPEFW